MQNLPLYSSRSPSPLYSKSSIKNPSGKSANAGPFFLTDWFWGSLLFLMPYPLDNNFTSPPFLFEYPYGPYIGFPS